MFDIDNVSNVLGWLADLIYEDRRVALNLESFFGRLAFDLAMLFNLI